MADHTEKALAVAENAGLSHFQKATKDELQSVLDEINDELFELQVRMKKLQKERTIIEMLRYLMYPEATQEDGYYQNAAHAVGSRLSKLRGARGENKLRETCSVEGCKLEVLAKGFCHEHYHQNTRAKIAPPLKEGVKVQKKTALARCSMEGCGDISIHNDGLCRNHHSAKIKKEQGEWVLEKDHPKINEKMLSKCCAAPTYEGTRHSAGDRYCIECGESCVWTLLSHAAPLQNNP